MAWTTPRTWVAAELVTAALFNTHIRDNEQFLYDNGVRVLYKLNTSGTIVNTTTETSSWSVSIPGGTLGTTHQLRITVLGECQSGAHTITVRVKYGATTVLSGTFPASNNASFAFRGWLSALAATNAQLAYGEYIHGTTTTNNGAMDQNSGGVPEMAIDSTIAEDSTAAKTLDFTIQHSAAAAGNGFTRHFVMVEVI